MISTKHKYQGFVLSAIVESLGSIEGAYLRVVSGKDQSAFIVEILHREKKIILGIYIKTTSSRRSPWTYTFMRKHQEAIELLNGLCDLTYLVFVNGDDGAACLDFEGLKEVLDDSFEDAEWVRVSRKLNQAYRISGKDGVLSGTLSRAAFPAAIKSACETLCSD